MQRSRFLLLIILAVAVLAQGLRLLPNELLGKELREGSNDLDFTLEIWDGLGQEFIGNPHLELPLFDPQTNKWTLNRTPLTDFVAQMRGLEVGEHGSLPYIVVRLPEDATVGDYRHAIASLAASGICRVGVFSPAPDEELLGHTSNPDWPPEDYADVYHVISVKRGGRVARPCKDRFPRWAPWAE